MEDILNGKILLVAKHPGDIMQHLGLCQKAPGVSMWRWSLNGFGCIQFPQLYADAPGLYNTEAEDMDHQ